MRIVEQKRYLLWTGVVSGACGMALEMSASRLLAPYFGTSTVVWSSIIGVVLLALSGGYFVGGKLAEKTPNETFLFRMLFASGLYTLLVPTISTFILRSLGQNLGQLSITTSLTLGSLLAAVLLFGLPVFILGTISPYLLALLAARFGHVGNTAGQLLALSTLGGLVGTFLPTLVLIPGMGTNNTLWAISGLLLLTALPGIHSKKAHIVLLSVVGLTIVSNVQKTLPPGTLAVADSSYQHIRISEDNQKTRYMQFDGSFGAESVYKKQLATGFYYDYASTLPLLLDRDNKKPKQVLILGLAGGTIARQLHALYGDTIAIDAVEIDPLATKLAYQYMGLAGTPITVFHQDGRPFLSLSAKQYDFIFVDAYQNELQIPWTFTTKEFWETVRSRLAPGGLAAMNIAALGTVQSSLVGVLTNTGARVFTNVYETALWSGRNASHLVLLTTLPPDFSRFSSQHFSEQEFETASAYLKTHLKKVTYSHDLATLTDNHAPLEWLMARDILRQ